MKKTYKFLAGMVVAAFMVASCGGGSSDKIEVVSLIPVKSGKEFQYINTEGKIEINPQFGEATIFRDGLALVKSSSDNPKWGFIDKTGGFVINAQYANATVFNEGIAWVVQENSAPTAINKEGEILFTLEEAENIKVFRNGLAAFSVLNDEGEEKWGFVNKEGTVEINPQFNAVSNFREDLCGVANDENKWGFIDKEGKYVINPQFDSVEEFRNGKCVVTTDKKAGVIAKSGTYSINPQFKSAQIDGDLILINQDGKYGWCDKDGKMVINPQFDKAFPFLQKQITAVKSGKSYGYINRDGKIEINPQYDDAYPFNGDLALISSSNKYGFIDKQGKWIINPQYDAVSVDYKIYKLTGKSNHESVTTDYFNINAIVQALDFENLKGVNLDMEWHEVENVYEGSIGSKWTSAHTLINNEKINNDANYSFTADGAPRYFAGPESYTYSVNLSGKGRGKEADVVNAIVSNLKSSGYEAQEGWEESSTFTMFKQNDNIHINVDKRRLKFTIYYVYDEVYDQEGNNYYD